MLREICISLDCRSFVIPHCKADATVVLCLDARLAERGTFFTETREAQKLLSVEGCTNNFVAEEEKETVPLCSDEKHPHSSPVIPYGEMLAF